jgi:hypothetical protein
VSTFVDGFKNEAEPGLLGRAKDLGQVRVVVARTNFQGLFQPLADRSEAQGC